MTDTNVITLAQPGTFTDSLTEILRDGAAYDGGTVEPRSGSNTPAGKNTSTKQSAVSPLDENPRLPMIKREGLPDE